MPRLQPLPLNGLSADIADAFARHVEQHNSRITNMKATMGRSLPVFDIYMRWYDLYEQVKRIVGARAAYLFAHAISLGNNCPLCTTYFRKIIIDNGENPSQLKLTETEQTLLDFGSAIAINQGKLSDGLYQAVSKNYSETEMVVLTGFAGQMLATNIFSNVFEVEIDEYLTPYFTLTN